VPIDSKTQKVPSQAPVIILILQYTLFADICVRACDLMTTK